MDTVRPDDDQPVQLLGEIATEIVGRNGHSAAIGPWEHAHLEREPEQAVDPQAIRVTNGRFEPVGYLPRKIASWLAPLVDAGHIHLDGFVPCSAPAGPPSAATCPLVLSVFLAAKGRAVVLEGSQPSGKLTILHEFVRGVYRDVQHYRDPDIIRRLAHHLATLDRGELLPETRLLIALLPDVAREVQASRGLQTIAVFRELMRTVVLGQPVQHRVLTFFPLRWPEVHGPRYTLLSAALATGAAVVEEFPGADGACHLAVTNRGAQPLLIPEGKVLNGTTQSHAVSGSVLVAVGARVVLPLCCLAPARGPHPPGHAAPISYAPPALRYEHIQTVRGNGAARGHSMHFSATGWDEGIEWRAGAVAASTIASSIDGLVSVEAKGPPSPERLSLPDGAAGMVVGCDGRIIGLDLFDSAATLAILWDRLSDAYAHAAPPDAASRAPVAAETAQRFLERLSTTARPRHAVAALGDEVEIATDGILGAALLHADRVCHLAAFTRPA